MRILEVYTDGSIEGGNPGGHGVSGWVIKGLCEGSPTLSFTGVEDLGTSPTMTNNQAEYMGVVSALRWITSNVKYNVFDKIVVHCDSKLVVEQCNDTWACNNNILGDLRAEVWNLCNQISIDIEFKWIPREENQEADSISRSLYDK